MQLSEICIRRPVFATVLNLIIVTLGAIFFSKLQIRGLPNIDPPIITIEAHYAGADALYMERRITTRIEKVLKNVKGLDYMASTSALGTSTITMVFFLKTDIEIALNDVRSKVSELASDFPEDMKVPSVAKLNSDNFPVFWIAVNTDKYDIMALTELVYENVKTPLDKLSSVGRVDLFGAKYYTMRIEPDISKMYQYKISPVEIEQAIRAQNQDFPAGTIKTSMRDFSLKLKGELNTPQQFENIILRKTNDILIKLSDVAKVHLEPEENDAILRFNGNRSMAVGIVKQSGSNVIDLSREVREEIEKIKKLLPQGVGIDIAFDQAIPVNASVKAVFGTMAEAILLVVGVTYLFLASARITLIPLVTIPVSLIGTFTAMYLMGFTINTFTLLAMILAIGLVVDDAIVMLENIFRHTELGKSPREAAFAAVNEISFTILAMTITLASVFLPIGFIEGFIGKLFVEFAWTLAFCVLFSGFVALTLTPMMASFMVTKGHNKLPSFLSKFDDILAIVEQKYEYYLNLALDNKRKFFMIPAGSIILMVICFIFSNKTFVPAEDEGYLMVSFTGPEGASAHKSEKTVKEAESIIATFKEVLGYFTIVGWQGDNASAFAFVPLKDWSVRSKSQDQIRDELNIRFSSIPGMSIFAISPQSLGGGGPGSQKPIEFNLQTYLRYEVLDKISLDFIEKLKESPIFHNIDRSLKTSTPTDIVVDRDKSYLYDVSLDNIGNTVSYLVNGKQVGDFRTSSDIYNVILQYPRKLREEISSIRNILIKNDKGELLPLESVAKISETITYKSYDHYNSSKSVTISADLAPGQKITDAINFINKTANEGLDSSTTKLEYTGQIKQMNEADSNIGITFLFAIIFIYLVLAAQFESFTDPLLILLSVPFSITGAVLALLLSGDSINMYSNIGLVTLIGLITKNSIMIVEFANQLRNKGATIRDAIVEASNLRLRPILMTTLATIFGAVPLILASGAGAAARNSIGLVIVGGMLLGTLFTIFVIPSLYQLFNRNHQFQVEVSS